MSKQILTYDNKQLTLGSEPIVYPNLILPPVAVLKHATGITSTSFYAVWYERPVFFPPITGYALDVSTDSNFSTFLPGYENKIFGKTIIYDNIISLSASTTYYYRVRHINEIGQSLNVIPLTVTTTAPPVLVPTMLDCTNVTSTGFTANWTEVEGAISYRLQICILDASFIFLKSPYGSAGGGKNVGNVLFENVTAWADRTYWMHIKVELSSGLSIYSNIIRVDLPAL